MKRPSSGSAAQSKRFGVGEGDGVDIEQARQRRGHRGGRHARFGHAVADRILAHHQPHLGARRGARDGAARGQAALPAVGHQRAVGGILGVVARLARVAARQRGQARQLLFDVGHRQRAGVDRGGDRGDGLLLDLRRAERHHHVGARHQRVDRRVAGAVAVGDRVHVHRVGDDHAAVLPLLRAAGR